MQPYSLLARLGADLGGIDEGRVAVLIHPAEEDEVRGWDEGPAEEREVRPTAAEDQGRRLGLRDWVDLAEAWRIEQALRTTRGNRSAAARQLGIGRRTLYAKMHKLGL